LRNAADDEWIHIKLGSTMDECEKIIIQDTLSWLQGNKSKTASALNIGRKTLLRKLDDYQAT
jgi:DNA-binding NtrC family response regulator